MYICKKCGHIAFNNAPDKCPVCWAPKEMFAQNDNIFIESKEKSPEAEIKHIPEVSVVKACGLIPEESCTDVNIRIGKTLHPMLENHFIQFIDAYLDEKFIERVKLTSNGVSPATCLHLKTAAGKLSIVENCNLHGYWMTNVTL
jgi:superoxide reductase